MSGLLTIAFAVRRSFALFPPFWSFIPRVFFVDGWTPRTDRIVENAPVLIVVEDSRL